MHWNNITHKIKPIKYTYGGDEQETEEKCAGTCCANHTGLLGSFYQPKSNIYGTFPQISFSASGNSEAWSLWKAKPHLFSIGHIIWVMINVGTTNCTLQITQQSLILKVRGLLNKYEQYCVVLAKGGLISHSKCYDCTLLCFCSVTMWHFRKTFGREIDGNVEKKTEGDWTLHSAFSACSAFHVFTIIIQLNRKTKA